MTLIEKELIIKVLVKIETAQSFMSKDVTLLALRGGVGDENDSKYTEDEFIKAIENQKVRVALLREDPIGYAVYGDDGTINECYVEYSFRDTELESALREI